MLELDHLTVIAPTLAEGVEHVRDRLGIAVPFGTRHPYMGTHNHRLSLGPRVYLEIVALDPQGTPPGRARWFGLDDVARVRADWEAGCRLRGWVARTDRLSQVLARFPGIFGDEVPLPPDDPGFAITIPLDGALPRDGAVPSLIDHRGDLSHFDDIPDLGARLVSLTLEHPDPSGITALLSALDIDQPPVVIAGSRICYHATIETAQGLHMLD